MTTRVVIRQAVGEDAEAVTAVRRAVFSYKAMSVAATRHAITVARPEERFLPLIAEVDGQVVAWGAAGLTVWTSQPGQSYLTIFVHPDHRKQGIGSQLAERLHQHLTEVGAIRVRTFVHPDGLEFARNLGYDGTRQMHYAGVELKSLPEQPETPEGIELVSFDEVDPQAAYTADTIAALDEPSDSPMDSMEYDRWLDEIWNAPSMDRSLSVAAMAGDEMAAFTIVETDGDRMWSGMTGTIPAYRGRGLAKLVKSVALRRAAAAGITSAYTSNDDENGPMLAINNWLGYHRVQTELALLRTLDN
ncbi:acetyltransferase (GNAT) family protein [Kribbella rubisoli]|uniref:Acetyltransferase (GNAT) family protein n=1 Tax=Kribbella rubisoli TaxID=3075929 RepID=A0A4V6MFC8_9ACTN|nr:GNAT family N-acetyltransferase [Kribbella rubisoli]RZU24246.1 acetyltransferase (GNAT) family protein [Kribbella rubisoli]